VIVVVAPDMAPKVQAGFKADPSLLDRIDAFAADFMRDHPGLHVSRTDAIVMLITEALNARGVETPPDKGAAPAVKKGAKRARKP
jgi:hypothetical protein